MKINFFASAAERFRQTIDRLFGTREIDQFLGGFRHLSSKEIRYVLDMVDDEVRKSRRFGLKIRKEDVFKEKTSFLYALDFRGGIIAIRQEFDDKPEMLFRLLSEYIFSFFSEEVKFYFENTPPGQVKNRYNCHLTSLIGRVANDVLDDRFPY